MVHIQELPTEVLDLIFQQMIPSDAGSFRMDRPSPSRELFPFNTASVCVRWHNILKSRPDFWQLVTIDVADNPAPFLDTFTLFNKAAPIDMVIFSSAEKMSENGNNGGDNERKALENRRARLVCDHLEPVMLRCRSVSFSLMYQSSLPHSADIFRHPLPNLTDVSLLCSIHDLESQATITRKLNSPTHRPTAPLLENLTLTGYSFLEMVQLYDDSLEDIAPGANLRLSINHLKFEKPTPHDAHKTCSLSEFFFGISCSEYIVYQLLLSDLSIDYRPSTDCLCECSLSASSLEFNNVSSQFIESFFSIVELSNIHCSLVDFKNCSIPPLDRIFFTSGKTITLAMENVPCRQSGSLPPAGETQPRDESICNAIKAFNPTYLHMRGCDGVCDELFSWLIADEYMPTKAPLLRRLSITDCPRFTSRALCAFIQDRHERHNRYGSGTSPFPSLEVSGKSPMLGKDDEQCIIDMYCQNSSTGSFASCVLWNVEDHED